MNKRTTALDQDPSSRSVMVIDRMVQRTPMSADRKQWRKKLTKKESIMFRPSLIENKMLETIILKVIIFNLGNTREGTVQNKCDTLQH